MNLYFKKVMSIQDGVLEIVRDPVIDLTTKELRLREYFSRVALEKLESGAKHFPDKFTDENLEKILTCFGKICTLDMKVTIEGTTCYCLTKEQVQVICRGEGIREIDLKRAFARRKWLIHDDRKYSRSINNPRTGSKENLYLLKFEALCFYN